MKILVLSNFGMGLYNFRKELLEELILLKHKVYISLPKDDYVVKLESLGCKYVESHVDRRGTNPVKDVKLLLNYINIIKRIKPDIVLTYTIKPNVYGGIACQITKTPYITNITGLGTSIENNSYIQKITLLLYRLGLKKATCVFFQNETNQNSFINNGILKTNFKLIPGSGVNLLHHKFEKYPVNDEKINFLFIGRLMKAKGIEELLQAIKVVKQQYPRVYFDLIGISEEDYNKKIIELHNNGIIKYHGQQDDVHSFIKESHAIILPSYHEGISNVLLESAASGRPVLASNVPGCKETFDEGVSGLGFEAKSVSSLVDTIIKFIILPYEKKREMGIRGRIKMENEFNRSIVINAYLNELNKVNSKEK